MEHRRLIRIRQGGVLGGVCTGLGAYLGIDPILIRIFFILLTFAEGIGIVIYLLLWIFLPAEDSLPEMGLSERIHDSAEEMGHTARRLGDNLRPGGITNTQTVTAVGAGLVIIGILMLARNLSLLSWLNAQAIVPALMVVAGGALIYRYWRENQ